MARVKANSVKIVVDKYGDARLAGCGVTVPMIIRLLQGNTTKQVADGWCLTEAQVRACVRYACRAVEEKGQREAEKRCET